MAAPTYFGSASNPADNGAANEPTTLAVTAPTSMLARDLVILIGAERLAAPSPANAISATGGQNWSTASTFTGANTALFTLFWCQFNGTWTADPSIVFATESGTIPTTAIMHVFRASGVAGVWVVDTAIAGGAEASASPTVITGITPTKDNNVTLAGWLMPFASTWGTLAGSGWNVTGTAQYRNTAGSDISAAFAHQLQGTQAATGDVSLVPSTPTAGVSFIMAWANVPVDTGYQVNHRR